MTLTKGVKVTFSSRSGHTIGDKWRVAAAPSCNPLSNGTSLESITVSSGTANVNQLTLSGPFDGEGEHEEEVYLMPQLFKVALENNEVIQMITKDLYTTANLWTGGHFNVYYGTTKIASCASWDMSERAWEAAFRSFCSNVTCVTVSRTEDQLLAPNGYLYYFYFDQGPSKNTNINVTLFHTNTTGCAGPGDQESMTFTTLKDGGAFGDFSATTLSLGNVANAAAPGRYLGSDGTGLPVYKVTGSYWTVKFDSVLGNLPKMGVESLSIPDSATAKVFDDVVQGSNPSSFLITQLLTGVPYYIRLYAQTEVGLSAPSDAASAIPSQAPPEPEGLTASYALHASEVQTIQVAATHIDEIQTITTSADHVPEVQSFTISAPVSGSIAGNFSIRWPEIQVIQLTARTTLTTGAFKLRLTANNLTNSVHGTIATTTATTNCIQWGAAASVVQDELENLHPIGAGGVTVTRSGDGGISYKYGYTYTVRFVGNNVAGNVPALAVSYASCTSFPAHSRVNVTVTEINEGLALGTDTEIQKVVVGADSRIFQGKYRLGLNHLGGTRFSSCINWDATAADMETALEALPNIDSVSVVRSGDGTGASSFGYTYSVYFDGNAMMVRPDGSNNPGKLIVNTTGCDSFGTLVDGVFVNLGLHSTPSYFVNTTTVHQGGCQLNALTADPDKEISPALMRLPMVTGATTTVVSLTDYVQGKTWSVTFDESDGDLPEVVIGSNAAFDSSSATASVMTVIDGNVIEGTFIVGSSKSLPYNINASDLAATLSLLPGIGNVLVSRSGPDGQQGYVWSVTFIGRHGDVPLLPVTNALTGGGASVVVEEVQKGNQLGGTFQLSYMSRATANISYAASASALQAALQAVSGIGLVAVTASSAGYEGGSLYAVTFLSALGDIELLVPDSTYLTGKGAVVSVREAVKGSEAMGDALAISFKAPLSCSTSQVTLGVCGRPVTKYVFELDTNANFRARPIIVEYTPDPQVQIIRTSSVSLDRVPFQEKEITGHFILAYNGDQTQAMNAAVSADDLRYALEALPSVVTVSTSRQLSYRSVGVNVDATPGYSTLTCTASGTCNFGGLRAHDLILFDGEWYRIGASYAGSATTIPLASVADSTVAKNYVGGTAVTGIPLYRWSYGYEWTVTFHKVLTTGSVQLLTSPKHALSPQDSAVEVRTEDCNKCLYVGNLTEWSTYHIHGAGYNPNGGSSYSTAVTAKPKSVPGVPANVDLEVVSGTSLELFWYPPAAPNDNSDISSYIVQWDSKPNMTQAMSASASCSSIGFGSCPVTGSSLLVTPPFNRVIQNLVTGKRYYVRVAARNSVPVQQVDPTGAIPDNTQWSALLDAVPVNQMPSAPTSLRVVVYGTNALQLLITPPSRDGGQPITSYVIEWDTASSFSSSSYRNVTVISGSLSALYTGGPLVYILNPANPSLVSGTPYYVRVRGISAMGKGLPSTAPTPVAPAGKPGAPRNVMLTTTLQSPVPIQDITVTWNTPTTDGGNPIDGYLVEWWTAAAIPEVQKVRLLWSSTPIATQFKLKYSPSTSLVLATSALPWDVDEQNLRNALVNLGYQAPPLQSNLSIGDVNVLRTSINGGKGYEWAITFLDTAGLNAGTQPLLDAQFVQGSTGNKLAVIRTQAGSRSNGFSEVQRIDLNNPATTTGYFSLSFEGSEYSPYISSNATALEVQSALRQLPTTRQTTVRRISTTTRRSWYVTFTESVETGNLPSLVADDDYLSNGVLGGIVTIWDGNYYTNPTTGLQVSDAKAGEIPSQYGNATVARDVRSYTINGLVSGTSYYVVVSAINDYGAGPRMTSVPATLIPPKQVPSPPTQVSLDVNPGQSDSLAITYSPPLSDGGDPITRYRVELDTTSAFNSPIRTDYECPNDNVHTVWRIATTVSNGTISGGYFALRVSAKGYDLMTDPIPYDATASALDELGFSEDLSFKLSVTASSTSATADRTVTSLLFVNDNMYISGSTTLFTVTRVSDTQVTISPAFDGSTTAATTVVRVYGGRGTSTSSNIYCKNDGNNYCTTTRVQSSGSVQKKIEALDELVTKGVNVIRTGPDHGNTFTWRVTFLDDSPPNPLDYQLTLASSSLTSTAGSYAITSVSLFMEVDGITYTACTGTLVAPSVGGLVQGREYYARVFAYNSIGYSLPQSAFSPEKPVIAPGVPSSVTLERISSTELQVIFNQPDDDGGDAVTEYKVEWSTSPTFTDAQSGAFTYLAAGSPYFKTITGLTTGTYYFVRVSAKNSQGYGLAQSSTPTSLNPASKPSVPTGVALGVTSDTLLTVSFSPPLDNGGDAITQYYVEWDLSPSFNSLSSLPNKGSKFLSAADYNSYTIPLLTVNTKYYVRVSAVNSVGYGVPQRPSPEYAFPSKQVPGRPRSVDVYQGASVGEIEVIWQRPRVPAHGIPCGGTSAMPADCPIPFGGTLPASDGGSTIIEYEIEFNERNDFTGSDGGIETTTSSPYTLVGLTPGRTYYVRVLARNSIGSGYYCANNGPSCSGTVLRAVAAS